MRGIRSTPHRLARQRLGRLLCLMRLLSGDLVVRLASQNCSVGTWSSISPHKLARWGHGHPSRLLDLLGRDFVARLASDTCSGNGPERGYEPYLGYLVLRYPTAAPEPLGDSLELHVGFMLGVAYS